MVYLFILKRRIYKLTPTTDIQTDHVLSVFNARHDLTAVRSGITRPQFHNSQWGIPNILWMTRHRHTVFEALPNFNDAILSNDYYGLCFTLHLGPFNAQMVCSRGRGIAGRCCREGGEVARQDHLSRKRAAHWLHRCYWAWNWKS